MSSFAADTRALDEFQIHSLIVSERFYRDHHEWDAWRNTYHPDASKTHISTSVFKGTVDGFVEYTKSSISPSWSAGATDIHADSWHTITPASITISADRRRALCRSLGTVNFRIRYPPHQDSGAKDDAAAYDLIIDTIMTCRLERTYDQGWKILTRQGIYRRDRILPVVPASLSGHFDSTSGDFDKAKDSINGETRQAYRCLQWFLAQEGIGSRKDKGDGHLGLDHMNVVEDYWDGEKAWAMGS